MTLRALYYAVSTIQRSVDTITTHCGSAVDDRCISVAVREVCETVNSLLKSVIATIAPSVRAQCGELRIERGRAMLPITLTDGEHNVELDVYIVVTLTNIGFALKAKSTLVGALPLPRHSTGAEGF